MDIAVLEKKYSQNKAKEKADSLQNEISEASVKGNTQEISQLSSDLGYYSELARNISDIRASIKNYNDAILMSKNESDPEIREMATEEVSVLGERIEELDKEIKKLQISRKFEDHDDNKSAILEIRAGAGGDEATLFAASECIRVSLLVEVGIWR